MFPVAYELLRDASDPIIDLGCGVGLLAFYLRERGVRTPILGIDCDAGKIARAKEIGTNYKDIEFVRQDARQPLPGKGTILLIEDEDAVRTFASRALASRGYTVLEANSGERALEIAREREGKFDLVISDVVMPEMDGPTLLKELRRRGITAKIIFISGYAEDAFEKNLEGEQDFHFLPKPFSLKQLAEAVKDVMER